VSKIIKSMDRKQTITLLAASSFIAGFFGMVLLVVPAQAQTAPNGGDCAMSGTDGNSAFVNPGGDVVGITGDYNLNFSCGSYAGTSACTTVANGVADAETQAAAQSGFPQETGDQSNNTINIVMDNYDCGGTPECAITTQTTNPDGSVSTVATIHINPDDPDFQNTIAANGGSYESPIEHEMSHTFGLTDTYNNGTDNTGLMGTGMVNGATWEDDPGAVTAIDTINAAGNSGLPLNLTGGDCNGSFCSAGQTYDASTGTCTDGTASCTSITENDDGSQSCNLANGGSCSCDANGTATCTDQNGNSITPPAGGCSTGDTSVNPPDDQNNDPLGPDPTCEQGDDSCQDPTVSNPDDNSGGGGGGGGGGADDNCSDQGGDNDAFLNNATRYGETASIEGMGPLAGALPPQSPDCSDW
jgi:hypothetical protein